MIELTNHCQLFCITCPRHKKDAFDLELGYMPLDNFKKILSQFEELHTVDLTGLGESLMHPDIFQIIRYIRDTQKVHIYLTTNTILLTPRTIEYLKRDPVDTLCISIDGTNQNEYSLVRGPVDFKELKSRVKLSLKYLKRYMDFIMCVVLMQENLQSLPAFISLASDLGFKKISLKPINLVANDLPASYYNIFLSSGYLKLMDKAKQLGQRYGIKVQIFDIGKYQCAFPWEPIYITWDGYLVPCCAKPFPKRLNFGNFLRTTIQDIINSREIMTFRSRLLSNKPPQFCNKCHIMDKTLFSE